jgi:hypothetical protein
MVPNENKYPGYRHIHRADGAKQDALERGLRLGAYVGIFHKLNSIFIAETRVFCFLAVPQCRIAA